MSIAGQAVRVRAPATSANLGPGFDCFGMALTLYDDVVVEVAADGLRIEVAGEGADEVPRGERHLVVRALRAGFAALGEQPPGLTLRCTNCIPHGRGLGSSAAAIVTGLLAARALAARGAEGLDTDALLALATRLEGHPDNVAACLYGGLTLAWLQDGMPAAVRLEPAPEVVPLVFIPTSELSTEHARGLLPATVPHADAAANAGRAALLVAALTRRADLLLAATEDRLHQDYRAPAMPESAALVKRLRTAGIPAVVSGAGPSVLVLATSATLSQLREPGGAIPPGWRELPVEVDASGAAVVPA